jgi:hypothetical protein
MFGRNKDNFMNTTAEALFTITAIGSWLAGIVLAVGWPLKTTAALFPPYAWYLVVERAMQMMGIA